MNQSKQDWSDFSILLAFFSLVDAMFATKNVERKAGHERDEREGCVEWQESQSHTEIEQQHPVA